MVAPLPTLPETHKRRCDECKSRPKRGIPWYRLIFVDVVCTFYFFMRVLFSSLVACPFLLVGFRKCAEIAFGFGTRGDPTPSGTRCPENPHAIYLSAALNVAFASVKS